MAVQGVWILIVDAPLTYLLHPTFDFCTSVVFCTSLTHFTLSLDAGRPQSLLFASSPRLFIEHHILSTFPCFTPGITSPSSRFESSKIESLHNFGKEKFPKKCSIYLIRQPPNCPSPKRRNALHNIYNGGRPGCPSHRSDLHRLQSHEETVSKRPCHA